MTIPTNHEIISALNDVEENLWLLSTDASLERKGEGGDLWQHFSVIEKDETFLLLLTAGLHLPGGFTATCHGDQF